MRFYSCDLSKTFPGVEVTVGMDTDEGGRWPYAATATAVVAMGAKHFNKEVSVSTANFTPRSIHSVCVISLALCVCVCRRFMLIQACK